MTKLGTPRITVARKIPVRSSLPPRLAQPTAVPMAAPRAAPRRSPGTAIHSVLMISGVSTSHTGLR